MNATPFGPHDTVTGVAFLGGIVGGTLLIVGELTDVPTVVSVAAVVLLVAGVLLATVGAVMASRASGRSFIRSLASGVRASLRFLFDFF